MGRLAKLRKLSRGKKLLLAVIAVTILFLGFWCYDEWSHESLDDRASWEEVQFAVAWVSESKEYEPAERFIKSTGSSPLPKVTQDTPMEQIGLRIDAAKCLAVDLMRTLTRQQIAYMNKNRQIPYSSLTPKQKKMLQMLDNYYCLEGSKFQRADLQKAHILVRVFRWRDGGFKTQFEWYLPLKFRDNTHSKNIDLMICTADRMILSGI